MRTRSPILLSLIALVGIGASTTLFAQRITIQQEQGEKEEKEGKAGPMTSPSAKITPVAAMNAAAKKTGGKAVMAIFEFDEGKWNYGVIVVKNHKLTEVDVDPTTGKAGATEAVTPSDEAAEFKDALSKLASSGGK